MLSRHPQPITWRCSQENSDFAGHSIDRESFLREVRNEVAPPFLSALFVMAVVEEGGGEGASDGNKDEPITRWKLEMEVREACSCMR